MSKNFESAVGPFNTVSHKFTRCELKQSAGAFNAKLLNLKGILKNAKN